MSIMISNTFQLRCCCLCLDVCLTSPILFGSKFAIAFQMTLIPLTMARYSIASLSGSKLNRYLPLNKALRVHVYLGYVTVSIVFIASIIFFTCYGTLCSKGEEAYCDMFTSEIMITVRILPYSIASNICPSCHQF